MIERSSAWFERYLVPPLGALASNVYLQAGRDAFIIFALPIFLADSLFRGSRFTIRLPKSVPPNVTRAFEALVPAVLLITLIWGVEWFVSMHTFTGADGKLQQLTLPILLMRAFQPLVFVQDSYPAALLEIILMMLLWSVGIHGMNVVTAIALPFWLSTLTANATAGGHGIVTEPFFHIFAHLGGSGATWPLVIYMLRSRSAQLRTVGKVALGPAVFNINET